MRRSLTVLAVAVLALSACGSSSSTKAAPTVANSTAPTSAGHAPQTGPDTPAPRPLAQKTTVTLAVPGQAAGYMPLVAGKELGEFAKENIELNITVLPVPDATVLLSQGKIDLTLGFFANTFNAQAGGASLKTFAPLNSFPTDAKSGLWARKSLAGTNGKVDPCALKGKTVSFGGTAGFGSASSFWVQQWLNTCSTGPVSIKDLHLSTLGSSDLLVALQSGAVDAGTLYDPQWQQADAGGYAVLAEPNYKGVLGGWDYGPNLANKPQVLDGIVRAMLRTTRTYLQGNYKANPQLVAAAIKGLGVTADRFTLAAPLIFDPNMAWDPNVMTTLQQHWMRVGGLLTYDKALPLSQVYDPSAIARVVAE
jgi:NitT/TauT family transport system substrate-binding protein